MQSVACFSVLRKKMKLIKGDCWKHFAGCPRERFVGGFAGRSAGRGRVATKSQKNNRKQRFKIHAEHTYSTCAGQTNTRNKLDCVCLPLVHPFALTASHSVCVVRVCAPRAMCQIVSERVRRLVSLPTDHPPTTRPFFAGSPETRG